MLLANFNRKEHLRHRAVSLRQHGFLVCCTHCIATTPHILQESCRLIYRRCQWPLCQCTRAACVCLKADRSWRYVRRLDGVDTRRNSITSASASRCFSDPRSPLTNCRQHPHHTKYAVHLSWWPHLCTRRL